MIWINTTTKYQCLIRQGFGKVLCGYVGVDRNHRLYGCDIYDDQLSSIDVHGGLTFADRWPEINDLWYFGFDCAHFGDLIPEFDQVQELSKREAFLRDDDEMISLNKLSGLLAEFLKTLEIKPTYKDLNFVAAEVESLAHQLKELDVI